MRLQEHLDGDDKNNDNFFAYTLGSEREDATTSRLQVEGHRSQAQSLALGPILDEAWLSIRGGKPGEQLEARPSIVTSASKYKQPSGSPLATTLHPGCTFFGALPAP